MGTTQSTHTNAKEITPTISSSERKVEPSSVSGRKNYQTISNKNVVVSFDSDIVHENNNNNKDDDSVNGDDFKSDDSLFDENEMIYDYGFDDLYGEEHEEDDTDVEEDYDEEEEEEEEDEEWNERLNILQDARNLKQMADFCLNPHKPVVTAPEFMGRNYFERASGVEREEEMEEDREDVMDDLAQLKQLAVDYLHPERPVEVDALAGCRSYFDRASAPERLSVEEAEERARILEDARALKQLAVDYMHPELPVQTTDGAACGRNYFTRASAPEQEEDVEERNLILEEMAQLQQLAVDYLHPELPVQTTDGTACGRNYFSRPSAPEQEDEDTMDEREDILEDLAQLKQLAVDYMHPERPVQVDSLAGSRNYFDRASAPETLSREEADERAQILEDARALNQLAVDYLHPELPVVTSDPTACGRNYFSRPSAEGNDEEHDEEWELERAQALEDARILKQLAVDYLHPELPVQTTDGTACGRNYFTRPSAEEYDEKDEERDLILEEMAQLKKLAVDYLHPELPVQVDGLASARNYFSRPSAPEQQDEDDMDDCEDVLADCAALKQLAVDYLQPERPVVVDALASSRNYFDRASAPERLSREEAEEQAQILEDARALKQLAVDYLHPELPVQTTDGAACGRNYFSRPSAPEQEEEQDAEERTRILEEMAQLKQLAVDYLHPELPVQTTDGTACGRNYFSRPSAPEQEDEDTMDEREDILADLAQLKQLAVDYMYPERPVQVDSLAGSRNYFDRASAPETLSREEADERAQILEDARALKQLAVDYLHPELPVVTSDPTACGRNYFSRPSAEGNEEEHDEEWEVERAQALEDARILKQLAVDYLHPELPVQTTDGTACGRNYFTRPSAEEYDEKDEERDLILEEMAQLKKLAVDYLHPELPVQVDGLASARNYFLRPSAPEQVEDAKEQAQIFQDLSEMKKLAQDYLCPEKPVNSSAPGARSYFDRASAAGHVEHIHTRKESIDGAEDNDNAFAYHEQVLGLITGGEHYDDDGYHDHSEHFDMDMEGDLQTFKDNLRAMSPNPQMPKEKAVVQKGPAGEEEEEGNLSRSPSSVMLFELAGC